MLKPKTPTGTVLLSLKTYKKKLRRKKQDTGMLKLPFPVVEYEERIQRVYTEMERDDIDVKIATEPRDVAWLSGTPVDYWAAESPAWIVISQKSKPVMIVRHLEASTHRFCNFIEDFVEYEDAGPINPFDPVGATVHVLRERKLATGRIGLSRRLSHESYERFQEALMPKAHLVDFRIENIRVRRSMRELECIRQAVKANQDALTAMIKELRPGHSEWGILKRLAKLHQKALKDNKFRVDGEHTESAMGSTCVQVGSHMLHMHAKRTPEDQKSEIVGKNMGLWLEPGLFVKEYVGCMIRPVWMGSPPQKVVDAIKHCGQAFDRLVSVLAPGKMAGEVDAAARNYLTAHGLDIQHRSGYMTNERWQEGGILSLTPQNPLILQTGHVFHCPIHVHIPGIGYMGVSEQVLITENGCEVLGDKDRTCPRQLFVK